MNRPVASFFLVISLFPAVVFPQTRGQSPRKQTEPSPSRGSTVKICQGVAIPDGYVIVGYVTTSLCPHGAYVLKKQEASPQRAEPAPRANAVTTDPVNTAARQTAAPAQPQTTVRSRPRRVGNSDDSEVAGFTGSAPKRPPVLSSNKSIALPITPATATADAEPADAKQSDVEEVSEGDVVRIDTAFVSVPVSVLDRQGRFVPDLQQKDFRVFENGVEQPIAYFEPTEKPFTVALLLDMSASTRFHLWEIKEAAIAFAKQLRPQDRVLVVAFSDEVLLLTEATSDLEVVTTVIEANANAGSSTRLYDAVNLVVNERLDKIQGRKAIVLFTDGVDTSSYIATYESTLREAEELDALIYPIQYDTTDYAKAMQGGGNVTVVTTTSNWPFPGTSSSRQVYGAPSNGQPAPGTTKLDYERADRYLHLMADNTGGRLYRANDRKQLAQAFSSIAEELRRQYSIGYYPQSGTGQADARRQIKVSVERSNVAVRARNSYLRRTGNAPQ
ncbi:MAG TPA: VWA domain-containing protein [Pyrinomonadaceae bacterium]|nr:VWA domain-containing protein [Pyrinomonadaceae bacterium]